MLLTKLDPLQSRPGQPFAFACKNCIGTRKSSLPLSPMSGVCVVTKTAQQAAVLHNDQVCLTIKFLPPV